MIASGPGGIAAAASGTQACQVVAMPTTMTMPCSTRASQPCLAFALERVEGLHVLLSVLLSLQKQAGRGNKNLAQPPFLQEQVFRGQGFIQRRRRKVVVVVGDTDSCMHAATRAHEEEEEIREITQAAADLLEAQRTCSSSSLDADWCHLAQDERTDKAEQRASGKAVSAFPCAAAARSREHLPPEREPGQL